MTDLGCVHFYYTKTLPDRAVPIAEVHSRPFTAADLIDVINWPQLAGSLAVTAYGSHAVFDAKTENTVISVSGDSTYFVENQFFSLSNKVDTDGTVYFFKHRIPALINDVQITDLAGNSISSGYLIDGGYVYHNFEAPCFLSFHDGFRVRSNLLQSTPVLQRANQPGPETFTFSGTGFFQVGSSNPCSIRFRQSNGYQVLPPYSVPSNDPWYPRIRFHIRPVAKEWGRQNFYPHSPYQLATWVPGNVLSKNVVEFERKPIYFDSAVGQYPDILIFDEKYNLKFALDGVPATARTNETKGFLFPWQKHRIADMDPATGRVLVSVDIEPTDQVFGFYAYNEPDVVYRDVDLNPFTNPLIRNAVVQFFYKNRDGIDLVRNLYHEVLDQSGTVLQTNDPAPTNGTKLYFAALVVGFSVGLDSFIVSDCRVRGGGIAPGYPDRSLVENMWDTGYWDGKPYPLGGGMVLFLPSSILNRFTREEVKARIGAIVPMGTLPVLRFIDANGEESV